MTPNRSSPLEKQDAGVSHGWTPLLDAVPQGVLLVDAEGRYLEVNSAAAEILGLDREKLLAFSWPEPWSRMSEADGSPGAANDLPGLMAPGTGTSVRLKPLGWVKQDGSTLWLEVSAEPLQGGGALVSFGDITKHHVQARKLDRLTELYSALSQVNQAIVWEPTAEALLDKICEVMVRFGKFNMAWIGWGDPETREVKVVSRFGDRHGYLDAIQVRSDDTPLGRGGTGTAIREGRTCVVNDFLGSQTSSPWHAAAVRSGYAASASIPIRKGGNVCGALVVYAAEKDYFGPQELGLLEEAAGDVTFSLDHHEIEAERKKANEITASTNEMLQKILDTIPQFICWKDRNSRFLGCNNNYAKMVGLPDAKSIVGKTDWDLTWKKDETENFLKYDCKIMENDSPEYHIIEFALDANNKETCLDTSKVPLHDASGNVSGILVAFEDITERKAAEQALMKSERFLREAQAAGGVGCFSLDINLGIWEGSETFYAIFGIGPDYPRDISGWLDLVAPAAREEHQQQLQDLIQGKRPFDLEFRIRRINDGQERWVSGQGSLEFDSLGQTTRLIGTMLDITERKRAEEALRVSEEKFAKIFNLCPDLITINRLNDGVYLDANQNFANILGYSREEVLGRSSLPGDLGIWVDKLDRDRLMARILAHGEAIGFETQLRRKDGTEITAMESCKRMEINGEQCLLSITRDITERKKAEELINKRITALTQPLDGGVVAFDDLFNQEELQRIQDEFAVATGVASIITQPDGTPITKPSNFTFLCSEIIRKTELGRSNCFKSDAILGRPYPGRPIVQRCLSGGLLDAGTSIIVGGHHIANWLIGQVRDENQTSERMAAYARKIGVDEESFLKAFFAVPSMSHERFESIANALFTFANQLATSAYQNIQQARFIAESKQAEAEKAKLQAQLQQSQKMESLGILAGGVAHDMNNVLGAILGLASASIDSQPKESPAYRAFDTISQAAVRGGKMVKSLLSFARQNPIEERHLDLDAILREEVGLLERTTLSRINLELDLADNLLPILGDANALTHAFMNLCVNAMDAMPEKGTLTLRSRNVDHDWIEVVVEDTGTGMPKEVLEKAMDPFFTTKEVGKGTGLGLSMVYSTVKAHRGQLELQSEPGQGTRVRMRFPACEPQAQAPGTVAEPRSPSGMRGLSVLLVDDDELIQASFRAILEVLGHSVTGALSGEESLGLLEAGFLPDLVILDMNMPGLGGTGTLPRLRALLPKVPVLLSTGRIDQTVLDLASAHPGVTLLSKPFSMMELQQQLEILGLG